MAPAIQSMDPERGGQGQMGTLLPDLKQESPPCTHSVRRMGGQTGKLAHEGSASRG